MRNVKATPRREAIVNRGEASPHIKPLAAALLFLALNGFQ